MKDKYSREIDYLRISVTDRCNLRCVYCMPEKGIDIVPHNDILTLEEIARVVQASTLVGVRKIRLTGGEPLIRKGISPLINRISSMPEIDDIALTTNGIIFAEQAEILKQAGLKRVNFSLDSLREDRFKFITRGGNLNKVLESIETAIRLDIKPVKINTVLIRDFNDDEIIQFANLTMEKPLHIRFIELMPIGTSQTWASGRFIPAQEVKDIIEIKLGRLDRIQKPKGNGPAQYYQFKGAVGTIGFISAISEHFCSKCNRLRLTSTGVLRPCLYSDDEVDIRTALRSGASLKKLSEIIVRSARNKPKKHSALGPGDYRSMMYQIGG